MQGASLIGTASEEQEVTTWFFEMTHASTLRPARRPAWEHRIERVARPTAAFARYLYATVGGEWHWTDRLGWSKARWDAYLLRHTVELHTLQLGGAPGGFVELERQPAGNVQLTYFGLMKEAIGKGFGGWLLTHAVERGWQLPHTQRVWVHTCTLDAPLARANYEARGFSLFRSETKSVPRAPAPGPWPGWNHDRT